VASSGCDSPDTTTAGTKSVTCRATDAAGNEASVDLPYSVTDPSPPNIDYTLAGTAGDNGWYTSSVGIDFTVTDPQSSVTTTCTDRTVTTQGAAVTVTCSATSAGGETPFSLSLKIDRTAPTLAPTVSPSVVAIGGSALASPHASDATSGVASSSCDTPATGSAGVFSVDCTARDRAGNTATSPVGYTVGYRFLGFVKPPAGSTAKAGSTVPIAFALGSSSDARLTDAQGSALAGACLVRISFTGGPVNPDCASYNPTSDTFTFDLKTSKSSTGNQTITVRVFAGASVVTSTTLVVRMKS
jgi:hypothetical protein